VTEYALALTASADPAAADATPGSRVRAGGSAPSLSGDPDAVRLTPREREVAALVARGRTNRQIAEALVVSERTVHTHVHNILGKLELTSRAQIAVWAVEHEVSASR
jgi:two-component system nitrate/nitrite response regulator NarL